MRYAMERWGRAVIKARRVILAVLAVAVAAAGAAGYALRDRWRPWVVTAGNKGLNPDPDHHHDHDEPLRLRLSSAARANLRLAVRSVSPQSYWRSVVIPGSVIDRPGVSDRGVTTPMAGVVSQVFTRPGVTVATGDRLFAIRLLSESVQTAQSELHKAVRDIEFTREQRAILEAARGAVSEARFLELDNQSKRLTITAQSLRQDLLARGLTAEQVAAAAEGRFVTEITITVPPPPEPAPAGAADVGYEVQELKVNLGEQVQAGQSLCLLADHRVLWVEGRAFKQESPAIARAAEQGWPVRTEFADDDPAGWPAFDSRLRIAHLANSVDPSSRTFGVYLVLTNQVRTFAVDGRSHLVWRFRPGQRARLHIPVERLDNVFVLPAEAVVREGAEAYVFRQDGDAMERRAVHLLHLDRSNAVIAPGEGLAPGELIAHNAASALNRALTASASGADHDHDHNH